MSSFRFFRSSDSKTRKTPVGRDGPAKQSPVGRTDSTKQTPVGRDGPTNQVSVGRDDSTKQTPMKSDGPTKQTPVSSHGPTKQTPVGRDDPTTQTPLAMKAVISVKEKESENNQKASASSSSSVGVIAADSSQTNEDLFLTLATDESLRPDSDEARAERRKSRIAFASKRQSNIGTPSPSAFRLDDTGPKTQSSPINAIDALNTERKLRRQSITSFSGNDRATSSRAQRQSLSAYLDDAGLHSGTSHRSVSSSVVDPSETQQDLPRFGRRRPSIGELSSVQPRSASNRQLENRNIKPMASIASFDSEVKPYRIARSQTYSEHADSVDSTPTSMKAVWDELDELKSRFHKLEAEGNYHSLGGRYKSTDSGERPSTATTNPTTTTSLSPTVDVKNGSVHLGSRTANLHPNLHLALAKAKLLLDASVYQSIENTAKEALELAAMTGSAGPQGTTFTAASIINGATVSDRQIRRKADNICRSVTDLCIALCDGKANSSTPALPCHSSGRPPSRDSASDEPSPLSSLDQRRARVEDRTGSRLALSKLRLRSDSRNSSYLESSAKTPTPPRLLRRLSNLQPHSNYLDSDIEEDEDPTLRAPSRAMTDSGQSRQPRRDPWQHSRAYTSRHPLPDSLSSLIRSRAEREDAASNYSLSASSPTTVRPLSPPNREANFPDKDSDRRRSRSGSAMQSESRIARRRSMQPVGESRSSAYQRDERF